MTNLNDHLWEVGLPAVNDGVLPVCPPSGFHPNDYDKMYPLAGSVNLPRYYASDIMGLTANEEPLYSIQVIDIPKMSEIDKKIAIKFILKIAQLIEYDDLCDQVGIKFLGKYLRYYCPGSENYQALDDEHQQALQTIANTPGKKIMKKAAEWSGCSFNDNRNYRR